MTDLFGWLAGSKVTAIASAVLGIAATICLAMPGEIAEAVGSVEGGRRICAIVAILAYAGAALGKGLGDRRTGTEVSAVQTLTMTKMNQRRKGDREP
jgi:hypothetical protein